MPLYGTQSVLKLARSTIKFLSPSAIKAGFWGAIAYFGPVAAVSTLGPVPLIGTFIFVHFGGPELLSLAM